MLGGCFFGFCSDYGAGCCGAVWVLVLGGLGQSGCWWLVYPGCSPASGGIALTTWPTWTIALPPAPFSDRLAYLVVALDPGVVWIRFFGRVLLRDAKYYLVLSNNTIYPLAQRMS